jgi:hypothetical protein
MRIVKFTVVIAVLCAAPCLASAENHGSGSAAPCGWKAGSLPDPADTQRCLADRYKAPKPRPQTHPTDARPATNATDATTR